MDKVSIIIPVYNVEKHLARCLESVIAQDWDNLEIICVNDGSTDGSGEILREYARHDTRIKVITQANKGLSGARNAGLEVFTGRWVMFVDSDDFIPPWAVSTFMDACRETNAPVAASEYYAKDKCPARPIEIKFKKITAPCLKGIIGKRKMQSSAWNKFYRADVVRKRRFIEGIYFEDWPFTTEVFGNIDCFALVRAPLYVYCTNGDAPSIVRSAFNERKAHSYIIGIERVKALFRGHEQEAFARKRCHIALKMLQKRCRRSSIPLPPPYAPVKLLKRIENFFHSVCAAFGALQCRFLWRKIDKNKIVFNQFQGGGFGCNPKYIALELMKERPGLDLVWLVKGKCELPEGIRAVQWKSRAALRELATAGAWVANHNFGQFVKHRGLVKKPGQYYLQTWHGSFGIKRCLEILSEKETAMMDVFMANSGWEASLAREWFGPNARIETGGHPRNDIIVASRDKSHTNIKTLLYVPTFRDDGALDAYILDWSAIRAALERRWPATWRILTRLHPNMRKKGVKLDFLGGVEDATDYPDIQELLAQADIVVSDYSSCIFDFALARRPAFICAIDRAKYETARGFYYPLDETPFPVTDSADELAAAIKFFDEQSYQSALESFFAAKESHEDGHAASRAAKMILNATNENR